MFVTEHFEKKSDFVKIISRQQKSKQNYPVGLEFILHAYLSAADFKLEDLTVLKRSPDLLNNAKIGQDQLQLKMKHILFYGGCGHFGQVT